MEAVCDQGSEDVATEGGKKDKGSDSVGEVIIGLDLRRLEDQQSVW